VNLPAIDLRLQPLADRVADAGGRVLGGLSPLTPAAAFPLRLMRVSTVVQARLALIGDAAHAIVPFYGQGMNCGFEDCVELDELIRKYDHNWKEIMPAYEKQRKPNGDAIADLAVANFYEMRDLVGHPDFLLRKKIEARIYEKHPEKWVPLYTLVTFSKTSYHYALTQGKKQDAIMDKIMATPGIESKWDSPEIEQSILGMLS